MSTPAAPRSRYSMGSAKNLVYSLLAVLGMVLVLVLMVPRVSSVGGPPVDIHATAVQVQQESDWPIVEPVGLPEDWKATSARYVAVTEGFMTWHAGYQTPGGRFVAVEQTMDPDRGWIAAQTNRAPREDDVEVGGRTWQKFVRDTKVQNSLLNLPAAGSGELATLVTGTADFDEIAVFIGSLRPVTG